MRSDLPQIGRYEVVTRLAVGGMAELFLARERGIAGLERLVVLKRILPHLADHPNFVDMFLREARIAARLAHPNVVQIYDLGEEENSFFIAMEYIHGSTVRELQVLAEKHGRQFPLNVTLGVLSQALRGLHAAHELVDLDGKLLGLVHRDVSPHNIMCTTDGHVKLLDFGVAKATEEGLEATNSGNLKGKFAYMSPEQARREDIDRRSDIFAMGIVAWEILTGARLFKRGNEVDIMKAVLTAEVSPPSRLNAEVPPAIDAVIMQALARQRSDRWATAEEMRQALVKAARDANLGISADPVAEWVDKVAGAHLALRRDTLQNALERSLTNYEREGLLHVTGSESGSIDTQVDLPLAVKMTRDAIRESQERSSGGSGSGSRDRPAPAAASGETVASRHHEAGSEATSTASGDSAARRSMAIAVSILLVLLCVAGVLLWMVIGGSDERALPHDPVLLGEPLPIAWSPTVDPEILRKEIEPLRRYLERTTGRPIPIEVTTSYGESSEQLLRGEVAFAVLPPLMYVRTRAKNANVEPIAIKLFDGAAHSDGLILILGESEIRQFEQLEGKTFCLTDQNSTTGNFLPRAYIRSHGYEVEEFIGDVHWSGDHLQAMRDLLAKKCDAAAVYSGAYISADKLGIPISRFQQLAITGKVPQDPIVAGPRLSSSDREAMRRALLAFDPQTELGKPRVGQVQRITAFRPVDDSAFDFLREIIEEYQQVPEAADAGPLED